MKKYSYSRSILIKAGLEELFEFHRDTRNLDKISPSFFNVKIIRIDEVPLKKDSEVGLKISKFGVGISWILRVHDFDPPYLISDLQQKGPFKYWLHFHRFEKANNSILMTDEILFTPRFGIFGKVSVPIIKLLLGNMFRVRHKKMKQLFEESV